MKIAHICRSLVRTAGTERFILETSHELARRKIEVRVYTSFADPRILGNTDVDVEVRTTPLTKTPILHLYSDLAITRKLIDEAATWADVAIVDQGAAVASYGWERYHLPCVPFIHSDKYDPSLFGLLQPMVPIYTYPLKVMESKCIRALPLVFANSVSLARRIRGYAKGGHFVAVPLGVDPEKFHPAGTDEGFVLMTGRYHPTNNFELGLRTAMSGSWKLVIAGIVEKKFEWYISELQRMVDDNSKLGGRVEFLLSPDHEELLDLIQKSSVYLSPRRYGYLGLAALEAMACGKPVIAHDVDENENLAPVMRCGDSLGEWRHALTVLMNDPSLRKSVGDESRTFVEKNHTIQRTVSSMLEAIATNIGLA